jgi:uncharacterized protein (TIGR03437 family)
MKIATCALTALVILMVPSVSLSQAIITTVAGSVGPGLGDGGLATSATLFHPDGLTFDSAGNLYISDAGHHRVRKVDKSGVITTVAGNGSPGYSGDGGPALNASMLSDSANTEGVAVDKAGNIYIADYMNNRVRMVNTAGVISTVAGNGAQVSVGNSNLAIKTAIAGPSDVALDSQGNLFIAAALGGHIYKVTPAGISSIVAGNGAPSSFGDGAAATSAGVTPMGLALDSAGNIYIAEFVDHKIRKVNTAGIITTIAGTGTAGFSGDGGPATSARINSPEGVAVDSAGNIFIAEFERVRKVDTAGIITTVAGNGQFGSIEDGIPATRALLGDIPAITLDAAGNVYIVDQYRIRKISTGSAVTQTPPPAITSNGVVNAASLQPVIVPNSWVTIFGTDLASKTDNWGHAIVNGQLPTSLDGVSVTIGGKAAYVYFISPGQINVLAPDIPAGPVSVTVTTAGGTSATFTATAAQYSPAFFEWPNSQPVATRQNYSYAVKAGTFAGATTVAAKPGDVLILWGTGFGPTTPAPPAGIPVPSDKAYSTSTAVTVTINGNPVKVYGAALASGSVGLYQVAIQVPADLADGDWPIQATIGGVSSPTGILLAVHH